ncbi:ABC transporter ATP-binding protein [Aliiruegeria sabulilitoris]|uniref:ABC transporter ATP-binding protein n=1 Tax=Aliiruegeria sabulilitoris TaxID=1510458 RepID=UPI0008326FB4|nr:ABC transporter ATP-binding protein [Aliiruegeria sabulilitoris]NDR58669.1 ABC transporter ATP-binding protein [Pseudoruegeria sp. M32A2M]
MITIRELRKDYGAFTAVQDISLETQAGEVFGLLGPNGAGKSTTIGCLSGLITPSSGEIMVAGHNLATAPRDAKRSLGVVPQDLAIYEDLPAAENLRYWGAAYGLRGVGLRDRVAEVLDVIGLADRAGDKPREFSGGMKRRLNFGCGIVHAPQVLLLDEPTVGVDPQSRERLFDMVRAQTARGATVLYTTHHMEEAETLCDRIAIVDKGRKIAEGTLEELRTEVGERDVITLSGRFDQEAVEVALSEIGQADTVEILQIDATRLTIETRDGPSRLAGLLDALGRNGNSAAETLVRRPNLESLFLKLTGTELRA